METTETELVIVGGGPGGYTAAFAAAERGIGTLLVERESRLGGVCLHRGCIPSKAYLHATAQIDDAERSGRRGIVFEKPRIDVGRLREWKEEIVDGLAGGLRGEADRHGVKVLEGRAYFESSQRLRVETGDGQRYIDFEKAIVATGSVPVMPDAFDLAHPRVMTSREGLDLAEVPERLLVIGGGYIGMELGMVYARLGCEVVLAEAMEGILLGADRDLVAPVRKAAERSFREIRLGAKVKSMATKGERIEVVMKHDDEEVRERYDAVLVAVGRRPNTEDLGLENTEAQFDENGFVEVDARQRSTDGRIYAIGDVAGEPLLAHKAFAEARIAVEAIAGERPASGKSLLVPAVVFTDPELAWVGLTEAEAKEEGRAVEVVTFSWKASGRARTIDRTDGLTKLILDPDTERVLGVGLAGHNAGDLITEGTLAIEMGATAYDLAATIHPHPTLSETLNEAAWKAVGRNREG